LQSIQVKLEGPNIPEITIPVFGSLRWECSLCFNQIMLQVPKCRCGVSRKIIRESLTKPIKALFEKARNILVNISSALMLNSIPQHLVTCFEESLKGIVETNNEEAVKGIIWFCIKVVNNIINYPREEKYRRIKSSNPAFISKVGSVLGGVEFMRAIGFIENCGEWVYNSSDIGWVMLNLVQKTLELYPQRYTHSHSDIDVESFVLSFFDSSEFLATIANRCFMYDSFFTLFRQAFDQKPVIKFITSTADVDSRALYGAFINLIMNQTEDTAVQFNFEAPFVEDFDLSSKGFSADILLFLEGNKLLLLEIAKDIVDCHLKDQRVSNCF
jgi:hypothetical protein